MFRNEIVDENYETKLDADGCCDPERESSTEQICVSHDTFYGNVGGKSRRVRKKKRPSRIEGF